MRKLQRTLAAGLVLAFSASAAAEPIPRNATPAGSVIARKSGEEVRFIDVSTWRGVDIDQDLLAGDVLRTNALGNLAVLFSDNTQIRLGRNTTMVVKDVGTGGEDSVFGLESGSIWARAERGGEGIVVETPAAAAAIRGTDWTMNVDPSGRTSLVVLEGQVELSNPQGSVMVARGEAASAAIGQAPTKTVIVDPDDREQMLFYISLRTAFVSLPVSPLSSADMRRARARLAAVPEEARGAEEWLTLAEVGMSYDGRAAARQAADRARGFSLTSAQKARLDLIDAMIAAAERRYGDAVPLFNRALPRLAGSRRAIAAYGGYFARSLADPGRVETPPRIVDGGPYGALAEALTAGFLRDVKAGIEVLRRAEQRYPDDPTLPGARAQFAMLLDDREQVKEAVDRALSLDPDDPTALEARANYRAGTESDLGGALGDLKRAAALAPGSSSLWNALGLVYGARGADRESESALKRAIELDPQDPVSHANLAVLYLEQDRLDAARREIEIAIAADPGFEIGLVARGAYHLKNGELDAAIRDLLAGSTANPAYAQGLLLLAAAYYENGERAPAEQALENADRLDPNDPVTPTYETAMAIDSYQSDRAIRSAQEALRRARARGGDFASLSASQNQGSTLNHAYRLQGLNAWGRYYGDAVFDPFSASAFVDQALAGSPLPFVIAGRYDDPAQGEAVLSDDSFSSVLQGLLLDPQLIASRTRSAGLVRQPFLEATVGGGGIAGAAEGWSGDGEVQAYMAAPFPISVFGRIRVEDSEEPRSWSDPDSPGAASSFDLSDQTLTGTGYVTASPTPYDRLVAYVNLQDSEEKLSNSLTTFAPPVPFLPGIGITASAYDRTVDDRSTSFGAAWSHTLGYRNVVSAGVFASGFDRTSREAGSFLLSDGVDELVVGGGEAVDSEQTSVVGAVNHTVGTDELTLRYGVEGGRFDQSRIQTNGVFIPGLEPIVNTRSVDVELNTGIFYADVIAELTPELKAELGLYATYFATDDNSDIRWQPRAGVAWSPVDRHWLRVGFVEESSAINAVTLAPIGVLGLQPNQAPLDVGGTAQTFTARWDGEWTNQLFTAVEYQHQELETLAIPVPLSLDQIDLSEGSIDRISLTANLWLTHGLGAFATFAYAESENKDPSSLDFGGPLPFVPEKLARFGLTYVHPSNVTIAVAATYVGERTGNAAGTPLDPYWTADAFATFEPFDKRLQLELAAYNLFDESFEVAPSVPGWGRTFMGSLRLRF